jgi:prevent-host-death family protein
MPKPRHPHQTDPKPTESVRNEWQLQDAKARFSEVFRLAGESGPQRVTHGKAAVVILAAEDYERLCRPEPPTENLADFFARSPLAGSGIRLERERDCK